MSIDMKRPHVTLFAYCIVYLSSVDQEGCTELNGSRIRTKQDTIFEVANMNRTLDQHRGICVRQSSA